MNLFGVYHYDAHGATAEIADLFGSAADRRPAMYGKRLAISAHVTRWRALDSLSADFGPASPPDHCHAGTPEPAKPSIQAVSPPRPAGNPYSRSTVKTRRARGFEPSPFARIQRFLRSCTLVAANLHPIALYFAPLVNGILRS